MSKKVVFLDRDGPINIDEGYVSTIERWRFAPRAIEGMKLLQDAGFTLVVITNQSAIAEGKYTETDMHLLHNFMLSELKNSGVEIAVVAFCPHGRDQDDCKCRKPKTGMIDQIIPKVGKIDYEQSWTIGDKSIDVGFGKTLGTHTALLRSRYWIPENIEIKPDMVVDSLFEAAQKIVVSTK